METLKTLRDEVLYQLDEATDTGSVKTNATNAISQAHVQRLTQTNWPFMIWPPPTLDPETFTTVASQRGYALHQEFARPYFFRNRNSQEFLEEVPSRNVEPSGFMSDLNTDDRHFTLWGRSSVKAQPTSSSVITIVSSSASDVGSTKAVIVRGETSDGVTTESINPNGTTPVAGLTSFSRILASTKSTAWVGTLTMTSNSGAVQNLKLFASEYGRSYQQLTFLGLPTGGTPIDYRFYRKPNPLSLDNDIPDVPDPYQKLLVWDALLILAAYDGRIDGGRSSVWRENQQRLELAMRQAFLDGQSLGSMPRYVRYIEPDW